MSLQNNHPLWYRVAEIRPQLVTHAEIQKQHYRGETWYVLNNLVSGKAYRFTPRYHQFIALLDGKRSVESLRTACVDALGTDALSQNEIMELLAHLYMADVLRSDATGDSFALFERQRRQRQTQRMAQAKNPLAIRIPLMDPDRLLQRLDPLARVAISIPGLLAWCALIGIGIASAFVNWGALTSGEAPALLSAGNLLVLALVYPFIKALHELGHGLSAKHWGGEVHQAGIMLIAFMPMPYVDASCAGTFPEKHRRILVSAAGIMVELALAIIAMLLWLIIEPGLVRNICWNVMLIGSVSTLLFNGNPLMRFDAYYIFSDAIDIPNLAGRSTRYLGYLIKKHVFALSGQRSPATHDSEPPWLVSYGILSWCYRIMVMLGIALFVAETYPSIGMALGMWSVFMGIFWPTAKQISKLLVDPELSRKRARVLLISTSMACLVSIGLFVVPAPLSTATEAVVIPPSDAEVRAGFAGEFARFQVAPGSEVQADEILIELSDPFIDLDIARLKAERAELIATQKQLRSQFKQVEAQMTGDELKVVEKDLALATQRREALRIRAPVSGTFLIADTHDMPGRFVEQGQLLGYVATLERPRARAIVSQQDIDLVRSRTESVSIRLADQSGRAWESHITHQTPGAIHKLPSAALGATGGGRFAVDPQDEDGLKPVQSVFELELDMPMAVARLGTRIHVRFSHGSEPLGQQWYRSLRQLFLSRLDV